VTCKRCGSQLVVDGTSSPASVSSEAPVRPPAEDGEYVVAFDDEHKKALAVRAIVTLYARGAIDAGTLVWREGMSEWKPLFEVEGLALALERAGHGPPSPAASTGEPVTQVAAPEEDGDVTRIFKPAADEDATKIFSNEGAASSKPKPGGWNEPAKWKNEGPRDPLGRGEWREQGAIASAAPRVAPRLAGSWSERGVEEDEVTRMVAPLEDPTPRSSDSERPLTGQRSESSVLFSLRAMAQNEEEASGRRRDGEADERALLARSAAAPLTADMNLLAPPSSVPPPAKRFTSRSDLPPVKTPPPARTPSTGTFGRPVAAVLGVSLIALGALYATGRWSLVIAAAHSLWQRLNSLR
jgi:hypothetical protein